MSFVPRAIRVAFAAIALLPMALSAQSTPAATPTTTEQVRCLPIQQDLPKIPELISSAGRLRATLTVISEKDRMPFRNPPRVATNSAQPGDPNAFMACYPQWVRAFRSPDAVPPYPAPGTDYSDPLPGPTLRARVGDVIELTFLNNINPSNFGASIDLGDTKDCDETSAGYPGHDTYPNCFHGSTTANLHFHGTHTNPNTTGDNVFLEVLASKRIIGAQDTTPADVKKDFDAFFDKCEVELAKAPNREWPRKWRDLPKDWTDTQKSLIEKFDAQITKGEGIMPKPDGSPRLGLPLWPKNQALLDQGNWPQYYVGSYPYCFKLPQYPGAPLATDHSAHTGAGSAELDGADASAQMTDSLPKYPLKMGQAPGTHWYHAHKHGSTTIDVSNGMTGAFIIEGKYDDELNENYKAQGPNWTRTQPTLVIGQFGSSPNLKVGGGQDKGPDFSVNGRLNPIVNMRPGEVQLWRIVNTSARAGAFFSGPPPGFHWRQLAQDGVQLKDVNYQASLDRPFLLAAGNRADMLVQATGACNIAAGCKYSVQVFNEVDPGDVQGTFPINLLTVKVSGTPMTPAMAFMAKAPTFPDFLADVTDAEISGTKTIAFSTQPQVFAGGQGPPKQPAAVHKIDGKQFDGDVGVVVLLNKAEEWKITNATTNISHPFHIHINPFQVVEQFSPNDLLPNGSPRYVTDKNGMTAGQCYLDPKDSSTWKPCGGSGPSSKDAVWWDVFPIPSGLGATDAAGNPINGPDGQQIVIPGYFKMRSRFVDYAGFYVIHCHILAHEDRGMMTVVEVAPARSPYSHH